jgi:CheY-like chemotaxis protein
MPDKEPEQRKVGQAAGPAPLFPWPVSAEAGLTAIGGRAGCLAEPAGGGSVAIRRPPVTSRDAERTEDPRPLRVLIAEDHPMYTELLLRLLGQLEWVEVVGCAANGRDAVVLAAASSPDLILMDIDMPLMNGIEATRRILARHAAGVLVLTASATEADRETVLQAGALAVLPKTIDPAVLVGHLQNIFLANAA